MKLCTMIWRIELSTLMRTPSFSMCYRVLYFVVQQNLTPTENQLNMQVENFEMLNKLTCTQSCQASILFYLHMQLVSFAAFFSTFCIVDFGSLAKIRS